MVSLICFFIAQLFSGLYIVMEFKSEKLITSVSVWIVWTSFLHVFELQWVLFSIILSWNFVFLDYFLFLFFRKADSLRKLYLLLFLHFLRSLNITFLCSDCYWISKQCWLIIFIWDIISKDFFPCIGKLQSAEHSLYFNWRTE